MFLCSKSWILVVACILPCIRSACGNFMNSELYNDSEIDGAKYNNLTAQLENYFKGYVKGAVRQLMPSVIQLNEATDVSRECLSALFKYLTALNQAKLWAVKMLDASSKLPPGVLSGTFVDYGDFDECLSVKLPETEGRPTFKGSSCAVEFRPPMPPLPEKFSIAQGKIYSNGGTMKDFLQDAAPTLHHKKIRFVVCVPSTCSLQDMQNIVKKLADGSDFKVKIPQCYTKESTQLQPIHWILIISVSVLALLCCIGSFVDGKIGSDELSTEHSAVVRALAAFSLPTNFRALMSSKRGSSELKCIYGIRALSMTWIILGHTYVLMDFELLKDPSTSQNWFSSYQFEIIHNGWLAVDSFFLIGGILVSYVSLRRMKKRNALLNVPLLAVRRFIRITVPLLLVIGLLFFLPVISSGPFWYEHVDPQVDSCRKYWWTTLLYISNWFGIDKGCAVMTWYLSVDFQLHVLSLILLLFIFRYNKAGLSLLVVLVGVSCAAVGAQTLIYDVPATVQISAGDYSKVLHALNKVHVYTLAHLGPHCIGMILGYCFYKNREQKLSKVQVLVGWCASIVLTLSTLFGNHRFTTGEETSLALSILYSAVHRSVFIVGVAWVIFACISGNGGIVNSILCSSILCPISRLTFMMYLVHPLVIWTRLGSLRERQVTTHYEFAYSFFGNFVASFAVALPCYLMLEAPLSKISDILFTKQRIPSNEKPQLNENSPQMILKFQTIKL